jgi:hypothetical protein
VLADSCTLKPSYTNIAYNPKKLIVVEDEKVLKLFSIVFNPSLLKFELSFLAFKPSF